MKVLLVTTQAAGIVLVIATMILLFFRRVYLDAETKKPIKFKLPVIGEVETQRLSWSSSPSGVQWCIRCPKGVPTWQRSRRH